MYEQQQLQLIKNYGHENIWVIWFCDLCQYNLPSSCLELAENICETLAYLADEDWYLPNIAKSQMKAEIRLNTSLPLSYKMLFDIIDMKCSYSVIRYTYVAMDYLSMYF